MKTDEFIQLAKISALRHELPPDLVCAVIEQESDWNEFAQRYEPGFLGKYVQAHFLKGEFTATEAYSRAYSWGLMQVMGQVARELGFTGDFLSELCSPLNGIEYGCKKLAECMKRTGGNEEKALLAYNGGGNPNYPAEVLKRRDHYKDAPEAT